MHWHRRLLLIPLLLMPAMAGAQDPADPNDPGAEAAATPPASTGNSTPPQNDSPFDYEASEQISEDLSVSFPVDI